MPRLIRPLISVCLLALPLGALPAVLGDLPLPAGQQRRSPAPPTGPHSQQNPPPPAPTTLLLTAGDLPPGYLADDAIENADATARTAAYSATIMSSSFGAYRQQDRAVVQYVALLRTRADADAFLTREGAAVDHTSGAARLTLMMGQQAGPPLAYQQRGARGEEWVMAALTAGPYVAVLGAYDKAGEQAAIDLLRQLVSVAGARLRLAATQAPDPRPARAAPSPIVSTLRVIGLVTATRYGRASDVFRPRSPLYWRATWRIERPPHRARETIRETVWQGKRVFYRNSVTDTPYGGVNEADDHLTLSALAPGHYNVTVVVTIGRLSSYATHTFHVVVLLRAKRMAPRVKVHAG